MGTPSEDGRIDLPRVTIATVDRALRDWIDLTVDAHVEHPTAERRKVPVIMSGRERFVAAKDRRAVRDKNGVVILPVITFRRTSIDPNQTMSAYGVETPNITVSRRVSGKTRDIQNAVKQRPLGVRDGRDKVVYEVLTLPFPDFSVVNYEIVIQTQYTSQMNAVIEKFFHELDIQKSFVMPMDNDRRHAPSGDPFEERKRFPGGYFVGFFDSSLSSGDNFDEFTDTERIIQYSTSVRIPAYMQLDPEGERPSARRQFTSFQATLGAEVVRTAEEWDIIEGLFMRNSDGTLVVQQLSPPEQSGGGNESLSSLFAPTITSIEAI